MPDTTEDAAPWDEPCEHADDYGATVMDGVCFLCGDRVLPPASTEESA